MTTIELKARLDKANETADKKANLLAKYEKKWSDAYASIIAKGYDPDAGRYQCNGTPKHDDCYWAFCDLNDVEERIKATTKAIQKARETAKKWAVKLAAEEEKEREREQFPEVLKEFEKRLCALWDEYDMKRKNELVEEYKGVSWREFFQRHTASEYDLMNSDAEAIHKANMKSANASVFNLWQRVKETTGDVLECDLYTANGNSLEGMALNGTVKGVKGTASVETISAGGWNIQKYHFRVLVHKM